MGGFYGSVQVRSQDRERVKAVAEEVGRALQCRMLVAPAIDGWVGLYPEMSGQDERVGAAIAEQIDADVLHLIVHDDDVFAYWLYREGRLVDSFWSIPGYFGEDNRAQEEAMAGDPEAFRAIVGDKVKLLAPLLKRGEEQPVFASDQLEKFAKVLKISNAVSAYEYLKAGETEGIKKWRQFEEVPAERVAEEKKAQQKKRSQTQKLAQKLKLDGLLLLRDERTEVVSYGCGLGNGFFVAWPDHRSGTVGFAEYHAPWDGPRPRSLKTPTHVMGVATSSDGTRLAMAAERRALIWDVSGTRWSLLSDIEENDPVTAVALSADGRLAAQASPKEIVVTEIAGERLAVPIPRTHVRQLQFDPTGEWIAVGGATFGLVAVDSQPAWRDLYVGGKIETPPQNAMISAQLGDMDLDELVAKQRAQIEKTIDQIRAAAKKSKLPAISEDQIQGMRANMEQGLEQMRAHFAAYKAGQGPETPPRAREQVGCAGFSRDGRWLWCGTHCGLRVYEWSSVPREAGADMPEPTWKFESPLHPQFRTPVWVWTVAEEVDSPAIVFGGGWDGIHRLDLETGETRELVRVGDEATVTSLAMAAAGDTLGSLSVLSPTSVRAKEQGERTCAWDVWSYPRLRG